MTPRITQRGPEPAPTNHRQMTGGLIFGERHDHDLVARVRAERLRRVENYRRNA